ncbi:alkyl hydroperoxide reductase/ Thiol specific antioxidant/ Mal allergen [Sphingopyxis alaskensis RB2256]|jgi:peroxiredoxin|uniref:thioredoxin-dependent peroxiredoxin n=2 Tax=Sphingopyxis alaskensis TaxID=117207 RepID=Q1GTZ4_SPHAL|nr:alkyl hydroperoxide reductase/ Thiol specific antioxidant/ Mal allergen [Sphingopyxis alaskensis RB2256]
MEDCPMRLLKSVMIPLGLALGLGAALALVPAPGIAALQQGAKAPDFTLSAAQGGKPFSLSLKEALKKGPVVLYFFPAAFTPGCTLEAHLFAEASDDFNRLGARVVGVTAGNIERVAEFSRSECRDRFAVAADPGAKVAAKYDATMRRPDGTILSNRTSFVIAPDGTILMSYTDAKPQAHVEKTMAAVRAWRAKRR